MPLARSLLLIAAGAALASLAQAGDPVRLDKAALEKAIAGKTINYTNVNGSNASVYFASENRVTYRAGNSRTSSGTWSVEDNGRYCVKITSGTAQDHCRSVWKTDAGYSVGPGISSENLTPVSGLE